MPGRSGTVTAASPDGTITVEIDGKHVGIGAFASARILVTDAAERSRLSPRPVNVVRHPLGEVALGLAVLFLDDVAEQDVVAGLELEGAACSPRRPGTARPRR